MAERRMFTKKITDADEFISLPSSTQALYLHLCMGADDDGFTNQIQIAMLKAHASIDDVKVLLTKRFILQFESGVIVIKHWRMANALRKDRYTETAYQEELKHLKIKENGSYTLAEEDAWLPNGCQMVATGKDSIGKDSIGKDSINNNILSGKKADNDKKNSFSEKISKIINYLNDVLETRYTTKSKSTNSLIKARLEEGHTVDDFKAVIDNKKREWGNDPKMVKYLRPETLFKASHFESYLNESKPKEIDHSKDYYQKPEYVPPTEEEELRAKKWREYLESDEDV